MGVEFPAWIVVPVDHAILLGDPPAQSAIPANVEEALRRGEAECWRCPEKTAGFYGYAAILRAPGGAGAPDNSPCVVRSSSRSGQ